MPEAKASVPEPNQKRSLQISLALFTIAALIRLLPVLLTPELGIGLDDMFQYDMLARSLAAGDGFRWYAASDLSRFAQILDQLTDLDIEQLASISNPLGIRTSFRAPLYPGFLSLIYRFVEPSNRFMAARVVQALIMGSIAPLTFSIARELKARRAFAVVAGILLAIWPLLVSLPLALATENLFLPLTAGGTLLLIRLESKPSNWLATSSGIAFGLATLTRSVIIGFPVLVAIRSWLLGRRRQSVLIILPLILLVTPWVARNTILHGRLTFVETSLGYNLYLGYHPENTGTFKFGPSLDLLTIVDDSERDQTGRQLALEFIQEDPGRVPKLMFWKLGHFWGLEDRAFSFLYSNSLLGRWPAALVLAALVITSLPLVLTLPLAILGWSLAERDRQWQLLSLLFAWYIGVHLLVMAEERFHFALVPMLAALAAKGLDSWPIIINKLRQGNPSTRRRMVLAGLLITMAVYNWGFEINRNTSRYQTLMEPNGWRSHFNY